MSTIGYNGRNLLIKFGDTTIAAVRAKTVNRQKDAVDVTSDDSNGWRTLLAEAGQRQIDLEIEGVATQDNYDDFIVKWNGNTHSSVTIEGPNGTTETASFFLSNLTYTGPYNEHVGFTASLQSSGEVTDTTT